MARGTPEKNSSTSDRSPQIRLLIVDDHEVLRMGLRALLSDFDDFEICAETGSASETLPLTEKHRPDVILLDLNLKDSNGAQVCKNLKALDPSPQVLVLTAHSDREHVLEAIEAGADGYLLKDMNRDQLAKAVRMVSEGKTFLDPAITHHLITQIQTQKSQGREQELFKSLSLQEKRVLSGVAEGWTNKEIALELNLSDKTVKNYLSNAMDKLGVNRRAQAAAFFVRNQSEQDPAS